MDNCRNGRSRVWEWVVEGGTRTKVAIIVSAYARMALVQSLLSAYRHVQLYPSVCRDKLHLCLHVDGIGWSHEVVSKRVNV